MAPRLLAGFFVSLLFAVPLIAADVSVVATASIANADGRHEVFAIGADGSLHHRWQLTGSEEWSDWSALASGQYTAAHAARSGDGRIFVAGLNGGVATISSQTAANGGWSVAHSSGGHDLRQIALGRRSDGHLIVLAIGGDGVLYATLPVDDAPGDLAWSRAGGSGLQRFAIGNERDGTLVVAAIDSDGHIETTRQLLAQSWEDLFRIDEGDVTHVAIERGSDGALWLLSVADGDLYGQTLMNEGAAREPQNPKAIVPDRSGGERGRQDIGTVPAPASAPSDQRSAVLVRRWTPRQLIADTFGVLTDIATSRAGESLEVLGITTGISVVQLTHQGDGSWPSAWTGIANPPEITWITRLSVSSSNSSGLRAFVTERDGRVFTVDRRATHAGASWERGTWVSLGRIPGADFPDLVFQARACFELLFGEKADGIRQEIVGSVPSAVRAALKGSGAEHLAANIHASSRCTASRGEVLGVWLDHEVWPGFYDSADVVPEGQTYALLIPEAAIQRMVAAIWKSLNKNPKGVRLTGYRVDLEGPDTMHVKVDGEIQGGADVAANFYARLFMKDGMAQCALKADLESPRDLFAAGMWLLLPLPAAYYGMGELDSFIDEKKTLLPSLGAPLCRIAEAIVSSQLLPRAASDQPVLKLHIPYNEIKAGDLGAAGRGVRASGLDLPTIEPAQARLSMGQFPVRARTGDNSVQVGFFFDASDLKGNVNVTWQPSVAALRVEPIGVTGNSRQFAFFIYGVSPNENPVRYELGTMLLRVSDEEGQVLEVEQPVAVQTRAP